jgi:hypothetical protein
VRRLSPDVVAQWVEKDASNDAFLPLRDVLHLSLRRRFNDDSDEEIAELSEAMESAVASSLDVRSDEYWQEGVVPAYEMSSDAGDHYFRVLDTPETPLLRKLRSATPEAFEVFCKMILVKLKADAVVDGGSHDGGVDFHAVGLSWSALAEPSPPASKAVVVGQAKRYKNGNDVGEVEVRSFIGASIKKLDELRMQYGDRIGIMTPSILAFWTTADFHVGAKKLARSFGIWYLNGRGLAQLAKRIGLDTADVDAAEAETSSKNKKHT